MSTRVFVGGLNHKVREKDLEKFFRHYGRTKEVAMKNGYAFVEFEDYRDAEDACYEMNGKDLMGDRITVERARGTPRGTDRYKDNRRGSYGGGGSRPRERSDRGDRDGRRESRYGPPTRTKFQVIIENLSSRCSWQDLKDYMRKAGEVTFADAHKHNNQGIVEFATYEDMKNAIEKLDDTEINGRRIRVVEAVKRASRSHSRSRSRSPLGGADNRSRSRD
ncbi:serine-arginine protein 55-like [Anthonomus grandis grandis]|uniref:serine-arginine protein 55-like n=1 Tax=Anthonomus grandis grandis TaxID=2921223 RepID=UPI0021663DB7|nr:serine-arginine protein 55-like [Anthonomus grandis grandis]